MSVDIKKFQEIVSQYPQLKMEPMTAFHKIAAGNARVYVARTTKVSRVDLSGFHFTHPAVNVLDQDLRREKRKGRVEAQLDFTKKDEQILEAFDLALKFMLALQGEDVDLPSRIQKEADHFVAVRLPRRERGSEAPKQTEPGAPANH